ncbi:MAG: winged helix-turn-helix domain-containing protein [Candidatus Woesearchaeota archaeon]|jgi:predicted transcriptional regulator
MAKKRERIQIIEDILLSIQEKNGEIKPTHLMYKSNLSHTQMKSYLEELVDSSLVKKINKKNYEYIIITDRGLEFLGKLREMKSFDRSFGLD